MLDRALEYFTAEALGKTELYYSKLRSLCPTKEEVDGTELEKIIRKAEQTRWSLVKSSQRELSVNNLEFVSFNSKFSEFKRSLASSVQISYPFSEEQLRCGYWKYSYMVPARDPNKAIFPCSKFKLLQLANAVKPEKMFIEAIVTSDPSTFRGQVYAVKEGFDTTSDNDRCAAGLNMWEMFDEVTGLSKTDINFYISFWERSDRLPFDTALDEERVALGLNAWEMFDECTGLSETEVNFYSNFWIRSDRLAFDTALDEERAARGLNEWKMLPTDVIKNDVCTKLQEGVIASRSARGPLSANLVSRRANCLAEYFSKHKFVQGSINAPCDVFFVERVEVQTASDVAANFKKHQELEAAHFEALVAKGAALTEIFGTHKQFKFKSPKAKTHMDDRMALRAQDLINMKAWLKAFLSEESGLIFSSHYYIQKFRSSGKPIEMILL